MDDDDEMVINSKYAYVALFVKEKEWNDALKFFEETLGFEIKLTSTGNFAMLNLPNVGFLALYKKEKAETVISHNVKLGNTTIPAEITLIVEDVNQVYKELLEKGVDFINEPADYGYGQKVARFLCPFSGILFEIAQEVPRKRWSDA